jgi:2-oxopent-4-enoate hydratase
MPLSSDQLSQLAQSLFQSRISRVPCDPPTERFSLSLAEAYAVSEINLKRRLGQAGVRLLGKKIGLTSRAVQKQLGVEEPDYGYLLSDMAIASGGSISRSTLILPKVEGETAFVLKKALQGHTITPDQVIAATDYIVPCIEVIDSRVRDWKIKIQDTVADNASSAFFVLGSQPKKLSEVNLPKAGMTLKINGELRSSGTGAACLDHPVFAVAWLANKMNEFGVSLEAGDVILSGAFGPVVPVQAGDHVEVEIAGLGAVSVKFSE